MSRYDDEQFLLWFTRPTPTWLELSAAARGVAISVAMELNPRTGALTLRKGLASLAVLVRIPWETLEPALAELIAAGKLAWDGSNFSLSDPEYGERRRKTSADRMREKRERERQSSPPPPSCDASDACDVTSVTPIPCDAGDAPSYLISSDLISDRKIPEEIPSARARAPDPPVSTGPPPWFGEAIETVEAQTGEKLRLADSWLRYSGHRTNKGLPKNQQDAVYWLTTVMVPEARKERRDESSRREREAKRTTGQPVFEQPQKLTPDEQRKLAEQIPMRRRSRPTEAA
jgi:hypothetical protein